MRPMTSALVWARLAVIMMMAGGLSLQAGPLGSLSGKLTDLRSHPLAGTTVILRNAESGFEFHTTTQANGAYRFAGLAPGEYVLVAERAGQGRGSVSGIFVSNGHEARVQTAIELVPERASADLPVSIMARKAGSQVPPLPRAQDAKPQAADFPKMSIPVERRAGLGIEAATEPGAQAGVRIAIKPERVVAPRAETGNAIAAARPLGVSGAGIPAAMATGGVFPTTEFGSGLALTLLGSAEATAQLKEVSAHALMDAELNRGRPQISETDVVMTGEHLSELPESGRDWMSFTISSVAGDQTSRSQTEDATYVALPGSHGVTLDGISMATGFDGAAAGAARSSSRAAPAANDIAIASIRGSNSEADPTGAASGGSVSIETQTGSQGIHGQASVFDRQNFWGARNPFSQWVKMTSPAAGVSFPAFSANPYNAPDRALTWDVGVGSANIKRRLFWFGAFGGRNRNYPGVATVKHPEDFFAQPTNDEMQVLSSRLRLSSSDPVAEGLATYSAMLASLAGLLGPADRTAAELSGFGRVDWQTAERHRFTLEGSAANWNSPGGGLTRISEPFGSHSFGNSRAGDLQVTGRWEAFATANLMVETRGSIGRRILIESPTSPSTFERGLNANVWGHLPQMVVDSRYGFTIGNPARFAEGSYPDEHQYEAHEQIRWVRGNLLVNAGADLRHDADATSLLRNRFGTYMYSNVESFISDALVFTKYGLGGALDPMEQHNCDERGKAWRDGANQLHGLGYLPCYSYYSQTLGPTDWHLSTNEWAGYTTMQWEPAKSLVATAALRWEREQLPPPIALLDNPALPLTQSLPRLGNEWAPRASLAWGSHERHWPVLRLGYGLYFARTQNSVIEAALTHTGSMKGDLNFFMRPTDNLAAGGAPPFPYVLAGEPGTAVKPGAVDFSAGFKNPEVHQGEVSVEEELPAGIRVTATGMLSLGRRLPVTLDENLNLVGSPRTVSYAVVDASQKGPLKGPKVTVPFYASYPAIDDYPGSTGRVNPNYQEITQITSRANSTYEAASLHVWRNPRHGLSLNARYTYGHAMDWNPNESAQVFGSSVLDPRDFRLEYGTSDLDARHAAFATVAWQSPWKLNDWRGWLSNGWKLAVVGHFQSGLPFSMRTAGAIPKEFTPTGAAIIGVGPGMNGSGGDNRIYGVGRNTYRYPLMWKADMRLGKKIDLGHMREINGYIETFNLFNHQNVTRLETVGYYMTPAGTSGSLPALNFLTGLKTGQTEFGKPLDVNATNFFRPRQIDFGLRMRF